jgi:hypothetical protein
VNGYEKVDAAIQRGEIWRAKEILRGQVGNSGYDSQLFERYGVILLRTADTFEAGKFLFLSGVRNGEYAQSIQLFVDRHRRRQPDRIWHSFPTHIRKTEISQWPKSVVDELAVLGVNIEKLQSAGHARVVAFRNNKLLFYFALTFVILILVAFLVGVGAGLRTIWGWFF